jgi:hypothetical protein
MSLLLSGSDGLSDVDGTAATPAIRGSDANTGISFGTDTVTISTGGVARVTTDASGNVGVGTDSPTSFSNYRFVDIRGASGAVVSLGATNGSLEFAGDTTNSKNVITYRNSYPLVFQSASTPGSEVERARIDSSGNLLVGRTVTGWAAGGGILSTGRFESVVVSDASLFGRGSTTGDIIEFRYNNAVTGSISTNGTGTTYGTSSDYRLKENVAPMTGALEKVAALNPVTYTWKVDGSAGQGFIAHELQAVVPDCVTGEKDAVETVDDLDAEGRKIGTKEVPRYQGVDSSFLVATIVAALQEQQAIITQQQATISAMETRLAALEA